jgi:membrane protein DedA with SNARE-associated domain
VWAVLLVSLGWAGSQSAQAVLGKVRRVEMWLLGAVVLCVAITLVRRWLTRRRE